MTDYEKELDKTYFNEELSVSDEGKMLNDECFERPEMYLAISQYSLDLLEKVKSAFKQAGWNGTGELGILYVQPFTVNLPPEKVSPDKTGTFIWHVRETKSGKSYMGTYPKSLKSVSSRSEVIHCDD
jgi:hypothetical protein